MIHNTPQGMGVFIVSLGNNEVRILSETNDADEVSNPHALGWSPDDGTFAFRWDNALRFVGTNGTACPGDILTPAFDSFAWLRPDACAYIDANTNVDNGFQLAVAQRIQGTWQETAAWPLPVAGGKPHAILAMGTNLVAWETDSAIWQMNVVSGKIQSVYSNPKGTIASISYSPETATFLFLESNTDANRRRVTSLFTLANGQKAAQTPPKFPARDIQLFDQGKGYAYLHPDGDTTPLIIRTAGGGAEQTFFPHGQVMDFFCDDGSARVYALASRTNEAPGIWLCDAATGDTRLLWSPWTDNDSIHFQPAVISFAKKSDKHSEKFVLIPPANFSIHKKYPVIIGMQTYDWMNVAHATYSQALANSGAYVALTGYHYRHQTEAALLDYTNQVLAIYKTLMENPNVDKSRVYLFAFSSSTLVLNQLIDEYPGRWRGVMLFNPTANLPIPRGGGFPPILITAGSSEQWLYKKFPAYQETLAKDGIRMETYVHPNEGHIERSQDVMYKRALLMQQMVFDE